MKYESGSDPVLRHELSERSLVIMKPGCQQALKHRVPREVGRNEGLRFSFSFRKVAPSATAECLSPIKKVIAAYESMSNAGPVTSSSPTEPTEGLQKTSLNLLLGDSISERLCTRKLEKGRKKVLNLSKGGARIKHVENQLEKFYQEKGSEYNVEIITVCVGTNDIRYCGENGVHHLKAPLKTLCNKIKFYFPHSKVFMQPILPQDIHNRFTKINILNYNRLIHECCKTERFYYLNVFNDFLDNHGYKNVKLFDKVIPVHPNPAGMGRLARHYINVIHNRQFNPLAY